MPAHLGQFGYAGPAVGGTEDTTRFKSGSIWASFPKTRHLYNEDHFVYHWDDFDRTPSLTSATTAVNRASYMSYIDTSNTITRVVTEKMLGVLRLSTDATDNDAPVITMPGDYVQVVISDTAGDDMPLWFESRWRKSSVTDNQCAMHNGFCEETRAIDDGLLTDNTGTIIQSGGNYTIDDIGFNVRQDNGEELDFQWGKASGAGVELIAALDSLVASTWVKTGFKYQPASTGKPAAERIAVFLNGVENATHGTATQVATATFPDAEELQWAFGSKNGEGTATDLDIDWVCFAQEKRSS
jgi:hypothetical protein